MNDVVTRTARATSVEALDQALRAAAQNHKFGILNVTDLQGKLQEKGFPFGSTCLVYDVCNPAAASEVLTRQLEVSSVLPCRIALFERDGHLHLSTLRPTALIAHFGVPELTTAATTVEQELTAILEEAADTTRRESPEGTA